MNREEWLASAKDILVPLVQFQAAKPIPQFYLSVGFPKGQAVGQCWSGKLSEDGLPHIFISPVVNDPIDVLSILMHEIIHTSEPNAGHRIEFSTVAARLGFIRPWTGHQINHVLRKRLSLVVEELGEYEHSKLVVPARGSKGSRLRKHTCNQCGSIVYKGSDVFNAECLEEIEGIPCGGNFLLAIKE